jgi:hypothetical protein
VSTKPIAVLVVAELGTGDLVQFGEVVPLGDVQLMPYVAQLLPLQTEIGLIMTKPFTGVVPASAVPRTRNAAAENNITCAIERQRSLKFPMFCLPP